MLHPCIILLCTIKSRHHAAAASGSSPESSAPGASLSSEHQQTAAASHGVATAAEAQPSSMAVAVAAPSLLAASQPLSLMVATSVQLTDPSTKADHHDKHNLGAAQHSEHQMLCPAGADRPSLATAVKISHPDISAAAPSSLDMSASDVQRLRPGHADADPCKTSAEGSPEVAAVDTPHARAEHHVHDAAQHAADQVALAGPAVSVVISTGLAAAVSREPLADVAQVAAEAQVQPMMLEELPADHLKPQEVCVHEAAGQPAALTARESGGKAKRKKSSAKEHEASSTCTDRKTKKRHSKSAAAGQEEGLLLNALRACGELSLYPEKPSRYFLTNHEQHAICELLPESARTYNLVHGLHITGRNQSRHH